MPNPCSDRRPCVWCRVICMPMNTSHRVWGQNKATTLNFVTARTRLAVPITRFTFFLIHLHFINIPPNPERHALTLPARFQPLHGLRSVRYRQDTVQSGRILIQGRYWSPLQHSISFSHMNTTQQLLPAVMWIATARLNTVIFFILKLILDTCFVEGFVGGWLLCFKMLGVRCPCVDIQYRFKVRVDCQIKLIYSCLCFSPFSMLVLCWVGQIDWYLLVLVFGALQMCMVLCYRVECDMANVTCVTPLQA